MALPNKNDQANNQQSKPPPTFSQDGNETLLPPSSYPAALISPPNPAGSPNPQPIAPPNDDAEKKQPAKDDKDRDDKARYHQNTQDESLYYRQPPRRSRKPYKLYNQDIAGVPYKSVAAITASDAKLVKNLLTSEQGLVIQLLCVIYHYRMNNVHKPQYYYMQYKAFHPCRIR